MINISLESSIMTKLQAYAKTDAGKKKFGQQLNSKDSKQGYEYARKISDEFMEELKESISSIKDKNHVLVDILQNNVKVSKPSFSKADGWTFNVYFDHDKLHRDSMWQEGYPKQGIDLARLINNGYTAKNYVYGNDTSKYPRSLKHRDPEEFIQKTILNFGVKYSNVKIEYSSNFTGGTL